MGEIASSFVSVVPSFKGGAGKIDSEMASAGRSGGSKFAKAFAGVAALGAGVAIGSFVKDAIGAASDLNESTTKIDAIFGKAAGQVQSFSDKGAKALGQTKLAVLDATATFGTFGKAAGLSGQDLAKFSTGFTSLSTDLASFYNTDPEQAVQAIGAALRGEAEPIRQFGVLLDDATLRNEALKLGLISTTKEALTPQQKVLAAQSAIYKQTADAQGDFAKTSGGLANQQRILSAQWDDMKARLGSALLPVVVSIVTALNGLFDTIGSGVGAVQSFAGPFSEAFGGIGGSIGPALDGLRGFVAAFAQQMVPVIQTAAETLQGSLIPAFLAFGSYAASNLIPVLSGLGAILTGVLLPAIANVAQFMLGTVYPAVIGVATAVGSNLRPVFDALFDVISGTVLPALLSLGESFLVIQPVAFQILGAVLTLVGAFLSFGSAILGAVLPPVIRLAGLLLSGLAPVLTSVVGILARVIAAVARFGSGIVKAVKSPVATFTKVVSVGFNLARSAAGAALGGMRSLTARGFSAMGGIASRGASFIAKATGAGFRAAQRVVTVVMGVIRKVVDFHLDVIKALVRGDTAKVRSLFQSGLSTLGAIAKAAMSRVVSAIQSGIQNVLSRLRLIPFAARAALGNLGSSLYSAGQALIDGLIRGISSRIGAVRAKMSELAGVAKRFLPGSPVKEGPLTSWNNGGAGKRLVNMLADGLSDTGPVDDAMRRISSRIDVSGTTAALGLSDVGRVASATGGGGTSQARFSDYDLDRLGKTLARELSMAGSLGGARA